MKKATFITIIAALLLLVSCNVDSEHGIYYQVSTAQPTSGINIIKALWFDDDPVNVHYFLADDGICYTSETKGDTEYVNGSKGKNIRGAYYDYGSLYFYYSNADGAVYQLDPESGESTLVPDYEGYKFEVSPTGYVYNSSNYSQISSLTVYEADPAISSPRFSNSVMLSMDGTTKAILYNGSSSKTIEGFSGKSTGFLVGTGDSTYFFNGKKVYSLASDKTSLSDASWSTELEEAPTGGYTAVEFYDGSVSCLLVRTSKGFTKIRKSDGAVIAKNVQFLSSLNDVVVVDMYTTDNDSKVAIVTYANGIRIADMAEETLKDDIL